MIKGCLIVVLFALLLLQPVWAIGISPARIEMLFKPNTVADYQFTVLNNIGTEISVEVYKTGNLSEFITISGPTTFNLLPGQTKILSFRLALPDQLGEPGKHEGRIGAVESLPSTAGGGTVLGARAAVEMQVWVHVPYPGKYAQVNLQASDADVGKDVNFVIGVKNLGTEAIQASDEIDIFEGDTRIGGVVADQTILLVPGESGEMMASWTAQKAGTYRARATVSYDGKQATAETTFRVGQLLVEIVAMPKTVVQQGQIAELTPTIASRWNDVIKGVYADVEILKDGDVVAKGRSEPFDLAPWQSKTFSIFVKTEGLSVGSYDARLTVYYAGQTTSRQFANILEVRKVEMPEISLIVIIVIIILILAILAVVVVIAKRRRHGKKRRRKV